MTPSWQAVSKPKVLSMTRMSLSMDFGTPTTAHGYSLSAHFLCRAAAPAFPPFPPITKTMLMPLSLMESQILSMSAPPLEVPRSVPPFL